MANDRKGFGNQDGAPIVKRVPRTIPTADSASSESAGSEGSQLNSAVIATVAGLVFAFAASGYMLYEGISGLTQTGQDGGSGYVSSVDPLCGEGWRKGQSNVDQMHCYMTSSPKRLCDPEERAHLIATIQRFERDYVVWHRRHMAASMGSIAKVQTRSLELGMASAGMGRRGQSAEEQAEQMEKVTKIVGEILEGPDSVMAESQNSTPFYQLEEDLKDLAADGLVAEKDFGYTRPDWVNRGLGAVQAVKAVCSK